MKILYIFQEFPYPPDHGLRTKSFALIKYMANKHECDVISFIDENSENRISEFRATIPNIKSVRTFSPTKGTKLHLLRASMLLTGKPHFLARYRSRALAFDLHQTLNKNTYDIVHLDGPGVIPYVYACVPFPTVLSTTDAISLLEYYAAHHIKQRFRRMLRIMSSYLMRKLENKMLPKATKVHVVSGLDAEYLHNIAPYADVNYIELPVPDSLVQYQPSPTRSSVSKLLITGRLNVDGIAKNISNILTAAWPLIQNQYPNLQLIILGGGGSKELCDKIKHTQNVQHIEWVEDYYKAIDEADIIIAPDLESTGIKNRVLYSLGMGKPVVGTPYAFQGLAVQNGKHCLIYNSQNELADVIIRLISQNDLRFCIGKQARELILSNYTEEIIGERWEKLYQEAIA